MSLDLHDIRHGHEVTFTINFKYVPAPTDWIFRLLMILTERTLHRDPPRRFLVGLLLRLTSWLSARTSIAAA